MFGRLILAVSMAAAPGASQGEGGGAAQLKKACAERIRANDAEAAVRHCKAAVALDPESAAAHMLLGQAYLAEKSISMVAEAKAELQQALDLDPALFWAHFYLARVYLDLGRPEKAKQELETGLAERPNVAHFLSLLGEAERKLGNPAASVALQDKALAADSKMTPAHYYAALAYVDMKREDEAVRRLEASIKSPYVATEMYLLLGSIYTRRKQFAQAEAVCRKAIALDPSRSESYVNLAQLYNVQRLGDKALGALRLALPAGKSFPATPYYQKLQADAYFEMGTAYRSKGFVKEAVSAFERSMEFEARPATRDQLAEMNSGGR